MTGWPAISWSTSTILVMVSKLGVMVRDTPAGTIEEVRGRLFTASTLNMDDEVTYDGVRWRVEDVQYHHILLSNTYYYECSIVRPRQLYPTPTVLPPIMDRYYPAMDPDVAVGAYPVITLSNNNTETVYHEVKIPSEFASLISLNAVIIPGANGNMYHQAGVKWGEICAGEVPDQHTGTLAANKTTMINSTLTCVSLATPIAGASIDDLLGVYFTRLGGHPLDTVEASCFYAGLVLRFLT